MAVAVGILIVLVISLTLYIISLQLQLRSINRQLKKRLDEHTRQPVRLELMNSELNSLAANINKCLKAEENMRIESIRGENHFKEMIANISHDLRTPLTAIKGYQQLMEKGALSQDQHQKLKIAEKHVDELGRLIEQFFEYSYLVNAEPELRLEKVNITNLMADCIAEFVPILEENNLTVSFNETKPVFALCDKDMTIRIIQNLLRNCAEHAGGDIEVRISAEKNVLISFKNFVKNSSEIDSQRLFDRFYTSDKSRHKTSGLGLSIVKLLADNMGGNTNALLKDGFLDIQVELPLYK